ncbi:hypothetical protein PHMEG_00035433, partial [Phytophthora megakarya]
WHCFGRSLDLGYVQKQHVFVSADAVFYLRLLRVKTAEEQGFTLVPDKDFLTCPLFTMSVALAMQKAPYPQLLDQLPALAPQFVEALDPGAPLHELLAADPASLQIAVVPSAAPPSLDGKRGDEGVHTHVNRLLKQITGPAGALLGLTSHSFQRGGAQHANGDDGFAAQWSFDRGAWDMTKINKAFAYITNTAREDRTMARVLSGWRADHSPSVMDIDEIDHTTREHLEHLQALLYSSCTGLKDSRLNVSSKVCSSLIAHLVRYYHHVKALAPEAPIAMRVEECMAAAGITTADMLAWSVALSEAATPPALEHERNEKKPGSCTGNEHLLAVIEELITSNRAMDARLTRSTQT